jgi:hypothetical protein
VEGSAIREAAVSEWNAVPLERLRY